jgi:hypothetical protein
MSSDENTILSIVFKSLLFFIFKARAIGDEAKLHDRLLDDLDANVEVTTQALIAESAHAEKIKETGKVCSMYICVAIEVIILFIFIMLTVMG